MGKLLCIPRLLKLQLIEWNFISILFEKLIKSASKTTSIDKQYISQMDTWNWCLISEYNNLYLNWIVPFFKPIYFCLCWSMTSIKCKIDRKPFLASVDIFAMIIRQVIVMLVYILYTGSGSPSCVMQKY